jgi:hypothetical protein
MAIALLVFSFINQKALNKLKKMQPWRGVGDLQDLKSIVNFLPIYATLKRINYLDIDVVNFYKQIQKNIGNELVNYIGKGQSLSQAIVNTSISNKLSKQMSVIFEIENQNINQNKNNTANIVNNKIYQSNRDWFCNLFNLNNFIVGVCQHKQK